MSYYICSEKEYWTSECPKKRESKAEQTKSSSFIHNIIKLSKNQKFGKMLIAISHGHKIGQVDMTFIINNIDSIFLDCIVISHIFSEQHLFSLY